MKKAVRYYLDKFEHGFLLTCAIYKVGGSPADKEMIANLQKENEELKAKVETKIVVWPKFYMGKEWWCDPSWNNLQYYNKSD